MAETAVSDKRDTAHEITEQALRPFLDLLLHVEIVLGESTVSVSELLELGPQSIITLTKAAGDDLDIVVNGQPIGRGAVIVVEERFGIRITEVAGKI